MQFAIGRACLGALAATTPLAGCTGWDGVPKPAPSPSARSFDVATGDAAYLPQLEGIVANHEALTTRYVVTRAPGEACA